MVQPLPRTTEANVYTRNTGAPSAAAELNPAAYSGLSSLGRDLKDVGPGIAHMLGADEEGEKAVTLDANGQPQVSLSVPWNFYNEAFNKAAMATYAADADGYLRENFEKLHIANADDPDKFRSSAQSFLDGFVPKAPMALRPALRQSGSQLLVGHEGDIAREKAARDIQVGAATLHAEASRLGNQVVTLYGQGGANTPEARDALVRLHDTYANLVQNPLFRFSQGEADIEMQEWQGQARVRALVQPFIDRGIGSLRTIVAAVRDPANALKPEEQDQVIRSVQAQIDHRQSQADHERVLGRQAREDAAEAAMKGLVDRVASGQRITLDDARAIRPYVTANQYEGAVNMAIAPPQHDDIATVTSLMPRVYSGQASMDEITQAFAAGLLKQDTASHFFSQVTQIAPPEIKQARSYIVDALGPLRTSQGGFGETPAVTATRQMNAINDFEDWLSNHPSAKPQDVRDKANEVVGYYAPGRGAVRIAPWMKMTKPAGPATFRNIDIEESRRELVRRAISNHHGDRDAARRDPSVRRSLQYLQYLEDSVSRTAPLTAHGQQ